MVGFVQTGDHVDVMSDSDSGRVGAGGVSTLAQNVLVLSAPGGGGGGVAGGGSSSGNIVLSVTPRQAAAFAFASDNGKVWITLRPPVGAIGSTSTQGSSHK